jgi:hypothetical protein
MTFYTTKNNEQRLKIVVMEFDYLMVDALKIMKGEDNFVTVEDTRRIAILMKGESKC